MYLKSLEIHGFKSFADKIKLEFQSGITAIVGPNGSGKSNVADAIRWVLGEQSTKLLRGNSMQDVIFAGTEARRPVSYAYVCITLDNSDRALKPDFDEVQVARRVYRSGESEYLINGSVCRLKDVQELFYDTGIGKEGYSIIGQGQIDRILSDRPDERRELFDEAAGIVKFKKDKIATMKKLENEHQSLLRVNDIINELESQLPSLEAQSRTAKEFLATVDELKDYELSLFINQTENRNESLKRFQESYDINQDELHKTEEEQDKSRREYDEILEKVQELENSMEENTELANSCEREITQYDNEIKLKNEQINTLVTNDNESEESIKRIDIDLASKKETIEIEKSKISQRENEIEELKLKEKELEESFSSYEDILEDYSDKIENVKSEMFILEKDKAGVENNLVTNKKQEEELESDIALIETKLSSIGDDKDKIELQLNEVKEELSQLNSRKEIVYKTYSEVKNLIESRNNQLEKINQEINCLDRETSSIKTKLDMLINLSQRYEGYNFSVKKIMESFSKDDKVMGVVGDLIKVDEKYEQAIEVALGGRIQNIVTEDDVTAKKLINFLKQNRYGRATFLPVSMITSRASNMNHPVLKEEGVEGFADSIVEIKGNYDNLRQYLLNNILIVDNIDNALKIAKKYKQQIRIVTLDGENLGVGGSMTGGDFKSKSNLLGRRNEIETLKKDLEKQKTLLAQHNEKSRKLAEEIRENRDEFTSSKQELKDLDEKIVEVSYKQNKLSAEVSTVNNSFTENTNQVQQKKSKLSALIEEDEKLKNQVNEITEKSEELQHEVEKLQQESDNHNRQGRECGDKLSQCRLQSANLKKDLDFNCETVARLENELEELENTKTRLINKTSGISDEIARRQDEIKEIRLKIEELKGKHNELLELIHNNSNLKKDYQEKQGKFLKEHDGINEKLSNLLSEGERLSNRINSIQNELEKSRTFIWDKYEVTINSAREMATKTDLSEKELVEINNKLNKKIKSFGPVNVAALDEYKEVSERYEFLSTQRDDIITTEKSLDGIIKELEAGMKKQFSEQFKEINKRFNKVFKSLFNGGNANLELVDPSDILETGISINVQPPGKKLASMKVLSGGEKALSAIALLFAIQSLKPSPFCLLDEIEAALDDPNVNRFARYLDNLTDNTQFILITHRKGTMAVANRLYGITMQEKGISTPVSVSLVERDLK